ncbi:MAG TPA: putative lipid II flippase FtsW [Gammaproteobacteria bacterium]|nr:putative lipid II flippase FtsW [Gammaproteobacteria bacterium]
MSHTQAIEFNQLPRVRLAGAWDAQLIVVCVTLLMLGLVMVASASVSLGQAHYNDALHYFNRQVLFAGLGLAVLLIVVRIPTAAWLVSGPVMIVLAYLMLVVVLIPGVGHEVNGSTRWLPLAVFQLQVSEAAKLLILIYLAGYLERRGREVRESAWGFIKPMLLLSVAGLLLLLEPDFGAMVVLMAASLAMMFLAGARLLQFLALLTFSATSMVALAYISPYRWKRVVSFMDPWSDPYNSGFQLVQSLIAFGRGEAWGVGLGGSVQKLFYLPEAHTDFVLAVLAEELGLVGVLLVIALFTLLVWRAIRIGVQAERKGLLFSAYLSYGIGAWLGLQAFVNIGVNMGVLPTKGLTLPLMSYGGSSLVITAIAIGLLLRIAYESNTPADVKPVSRNKRKRGKARS